MNRTLAMQYFIDGGGHDGCSVLAFLARRPAFRAISFEPNPALWKHYRFLPVELVRKAVATHDGMVEFTVDPIDGDGSSILPEKQVVRDGSLSNEECPRVRVPCIDLSAFVARTVRPGDFLCLKLDVEGAEYAILEKMLRDRTIDLVDELYVEFHWDRCGVSRERHDCLCAELARRTRLSEWHAPKNLLVHGGSLRNRVRRFLLLAKLWPRHLLARARGRGATATAVHPRLVP